MKRLLVMLDCLVDDPFFRGASPPEWGAGDIGGCVQWERSSHRQITATSNISHSHSHRHHQPQHIPDFFHRSSGGRVC